MGVVPANLYIFQRIAHAMMKQGVNYYLGAKAKLDGPVSDIRKIDCSGFMRYCLYHATYEKQLPAFPDGSWNQKAWCANAGLAQVSYPVAGSTPNAFYLAFMDPVIVEGKIVESGHVWAVRDGFTYESHGSHGPDSRPWNTPVLRLGVSACFAFPHEWSVVPISVLRGS